MIMGPRQVEKSTLLKKVAECSEYKVKRLDCDDVTVRARLEIHTFPNLEQVVSGAELLLIDEAQRVKNIGLTLKIITDQLPDVRLLVSGSSAFELANEIHEPLTDRKWEYFLYPMATKEIVDYQDSFEEERYLEQRLLGCIPK